jgi:glyoxylase-like metal-dependent hydrolase (beta-lactamase superfamily II)
MNEIEERMSQRPDVYGFFHADTFSIAYIVADPATKRAALVDAVLDYDEKAGRISTAFADRMLGAVAELGLTVDWILDTHPHADHLMAAQYLKEKLGARTGIGEHVTDVQRLWKGIYNLPDFPADGSQWDKLFAAGERFKVGSIDGQVMFSPGHTLASVTYVVGDAAFVHDTIFQPDFGTARADFPGGDAAILYRSIQDILALPDETRLFTGHDYMPGGREPRWESTVGEQKRHNPHLMNNRSEAEFVALRHARDRELPMPRLILHALQVNMNAGRLPQPEANGHTYLKIPIGVLTGG